MTDHTEDLIQAIVDRLFNGNGPGPLRGQENYREWKMWVTDLLVLQGLGKHIESGYVRDVPIPPAVPPAEVAQDSRDDARALATIRMLLGPGPRMALLCLCPPSDSGHHSLTANQAWHTLHDLYKPTHEDLFNVMRRIRDISRSQPGSSTDPATDIEPLIQLLYRQRHIKAELGSPMDDGDFAEHILVSLPASWEAFALDLASRYDNRDMRLRRSNDPSSATAGPRDVRGTFSLSEVMRQIYAEQRRRRLRAEGARDMLPRHGRSGQNAGAGVRSLKTRGTMSGGRRV